jgi:cyclophilin family peptidyl-prolyl cis-trans isomerase
MKFEQYILVFVVIALLVTGAYFAFQQPKPEDKESLNIEGYSQEGQPENVQGLQQQSAQQQESLSIQPPTMQIDKAKSYTAVLKTTEGDIKVQLTADKTPITVNNFVTLAKKNFYNNTIFHRVIKGFMIQGGDPTGTGSGGPGYKFDDEPFEGEYTRGTIAMANAGPNTNGSQFFIMHKDYPLPPNYVIFGKVIEGIEVVDKIAEAEVQSSGMGEASKPVKPVKVNSVEIVEE